MKKSDLAIAIMGPGKPVGAELEDDSGDLGDPVHMAAQEMLTAIKKNDGKALAEAIRAAVMACGNGYSEDD